MHEVTFYLCSCLRNNHSYYINRGICITKGRLKLKILPLEMKNILALPSSDDIASVKNVLWRLAGLASELASDSRHHRIHHGLLKISRFGHYRIFSCLLFFLMYSHVPKEKPRTFIRHLKKFSYSFPYFYQKFHRTLIPTHTFPKLLASFSWGSLFTLWNSMTVL